jgi:hypothetical protein
MKRIALIRLAAIVLSPTAQAVGPNLDLVISVDFNEATPAEAAAHIARLLTINYDVDPGLTGRVTLRAPRIRAKTALDALCENAGCRWRFSKTWDLSIVPASAPVQHTVNIAKLYEPVDFALQGADIKDVLRILSQISGVPLKVDPKGTGIIDIDVKNTAPAEALTQACRKAQCHWELNTTDTGPVLWVVPAFKVEYK